MAETAHDIQSIHIPKPCWNNGRVWLGEMCRQLPCDHYVVGLLHLDNPQIDEMLVAQGWNDGQIAAWCREAARDTLFTTARQQGAVSLGENNSNARNTLPGPGATLVCMLPESIDRRRWWWMQVARSEGTYTESQRRLSHILLRQAQVRFNYVAEAGMGRVLLGHDSRLIHADPTTEQRLLEKPQVLDQLIEALQVIAAQRWSNHAPHAHDFAVELDGAPHWICYHRDGLSRDPALHHWYIELRPLPDGDLPTVLGIEDARIAQSVAYLHDNFHRSPGLAEVADAVELSPFHFHRLFCRHVGVSPKQYLQRKQLQVAKWLLRTSRTPIGDIAKHTGFSSHGHFTSTFHRVTGFSPSDYREKF